MSKCERCGADVAHPAVTGYGCGDGVVEDLCDSCDALQMVLTELEATRWMPEGSLDTWQQTREGQNHEARVC